RPIHHQGSASRGCREHPRSWPEEAGAHPRPSTRELGSPIAQCQTPTSPIALETPLRYTRKSLQKTGRHLEEQIHKACYLRPYFRDAVRVVIEVGPLDLLRYCCEDLPIFPAYSNSSLIFRNLP